MAAALMVRLLQARRKRLVASIMGHAEREFYSQLTPQQQAAFRQKVLSSVDEFADLIRDLLKITGDEASVNDHAIELLESIHRKIV